MSKNIPKAPDWVLKKRGLTQRQWRAVKRKELSDAYKALRVYLCGAAYTPYDPQACIGNVLRDVETMRKSISAKNWEGRKQP